VSQSDTGSATRTVSIAAPDVAAARRWVKEAARLAGLDQEEADRFTLAVNEIAINAIEHGGGAADITISRENHRVVVVVQDHGAGLTVAVPVALPPPDQPHGRGLWLAHQLCDDVSLDVSDRGTRIRLSASARRWRRVSPAS
jgi:serine/threonine-protein kinase RsbW